MAGGPVGLAAIGGLAVVGAAEYALAGHGDHRAPALDDLGRPSEAALRAIERLTADGGASDASPEPVDPSPASDPWRDLPSRDAV